MQPLMIVFSFICTLLLVVKKLLKFLCFDEAMLCNLVTYVIKLNPYMMFIWLCLEVCFMPYWDATMWEAAQNWRSSLCNNQTHQYENYRATLLPCNTLTPDCLTVVTGYTYVQKGDLHLVMYKLQLCINPILLCN